MKKYKLDFVLEAWVRNLEIEADSEEDAINKLHRMDIEEIIKKGYVDESDSKNIDVEVISKSYEVEVTINKWSDTYLDREDEVEVVKYDSLPKTVKLILEDIPEDQSLELTVVEELEFEYEFEPEEYVIKILSEF